MRPNLGLLALVAAAVGLLTGPFLALDYAPTLATAHASVAYIEHEVTLGSLLRGLHHWSATFALVLALLHGARLLFHGRYKRPRQRLWVTGACLGLVLLGLAHTGYLLPGDERAVAGMNVLRGVAASTPLVGEEAAAIVTGGSTVSSATLTRLHVVHTVLLPALLVVLVVAFLRGWRRLGPALPHAAEEAAPAATRRGLLADHASWMTGLLAALAVCALLHPAPLGPAPDLDGGAPPDARPEWFFLWVNQLLRMLPGATFLAAAALPALAALAVLALPWVASRPERAPRRRRFELTAAVAVALTLVALSVASLPGAGGTARVRAGAPDAATPADVEPILQKFQCRGCHVIDDDPAGGDQGPPLVREGFAELYTETFFRRKVGDPVGFWPDTNMRYTPKRLRPSEEELAALAAWFFRDGR